MLRLLITTTIATILGGSISVLAPQVQAFPKHIALFGIGEKKEKEPADVLVTKAEIQTEEIAGTQYHKLSGRLLNGSENLIWYPLVHFEIYSETTDAIIKAGTVKVFPEVLESGKEGVFEQDLSSGGGKLKITLVRWKSQDKVLKSAEQMEFFP